MQRFLLTIILIFSSLMTISVQQVMAQALPAFEAINAVLEGVAEGSVAWGDYDGDGDLDVLLTGRNASGQGISQVYRNNGDNTFTDINAGLAGVSFSSVAWGDYDGDGDLDILLTGFSASSRISQVYRNDGGDNFTAISAGLEGVSFSSVAWGDYDGDGDLDILLTGQAASGRISRVYRNNGDNTFEDINAGLEGVGFSSVAWGDYDGDGDLDILLTGQAASGRISRVYRNNGDNTFED
ncbi:FG-GAP-like repeat-containing protein, partial [Penaeicola halotolerans]|uniref:FG-GAP-like repeat-containing protein n=1 Tax=Penaeicola halotolerans TaxID=2793196 RepID=UPI001CF8A338